MRLIKQAQIVKSSWHWLLIGITLALTACVPITAPPPASEAESAQETTMSELFGTVWQWQNDTLADTTSYTIEFLPEGQFQLQADCNRGRGAYKLVGNLLTIDGVALTRMGCPPGSLDQTFLEQVGGTDGYRVDGENLVLTTQVEPGTITFIPVAAPDDTVPSDAQASGLLTGTVTYLQRIALPPGSVIEVQLQDVSKQDVAAEVIASQTITTAGENVPIPFELSYDPAQIEERFTYALSVRITINGQLAWLNTDRYAVLTRGAPATGVEVLVRPAQ